MDDAEKLRKIESDVAKNAPYCFGTTEFDYQSDICKRCMFANDCAKRLGLRGSVF